MIGDGITAFDVARTARRKGAKEVVVIAQHQAGRHPGGRPRPGRRPRGGRQGRVRRPGQEGQGQGRQGAGRRVRPRRAREGPHQGGPRLPLRDRRHHRRHGHRLRPASSATAPTTWRCPTAPGCSPTTTPGARPKRACSPPATPSPARSRSIHAVAGGKRSALAVDAWLRGEDLEELEEKLAVYNGLPYLDQLKDEAQLGELGARLAERSPVWLKMGASAEAAARATMPKVGKQKRLSALDLEVEKGYSLAAARAEADALPAVRVPQQRRLRPADARRRVRRHRQRTRRQGRPGARGRAPVRAPVHPPRHGAAASPAAGACASAAMSPVRPATTSPAGASRSTSTPPTATPCSSPTASPAAAA